jgi:hypothetical protein
VPSAAASAHEKACSNATLKGAFGHTGLITSPASLAGPNASVSTIILDGNGAFMEVGVISINGNIVHASGTGTYTVDPDCTGTYEVQAPQLGVTFHGFLVIVDGGNEIQFISTDPGTVITAVVKKQSPTVRRREEGDLDDWKE